MAPGDTTPPLRGAEKPTCGASSARVGRGTDRTMHLILASASPRRRQLLAEAGYSFEVNPSGVEEPEPEGVVDLGAYVAALAWRKALAVAGRRREGLVLAADTACGV